MQESLQEVESCTHEDSEQHLINLLHTSLSQHCLMAHTKLAASG